MARKRGKTKATGIDENIVNQEIRARQHERNTLSKWVTFAQLY